MNDFREQFEIAMPIHRTPPRREIVFGTWLHVPVFRVMDLADVEIAVGEAVTNAILVWLTRCRSQPYRDCQRAKCGGAFFRRDSRSRPRLRSKPCARRKKTTTPFGGRGIRLMRALMDQVDLHYGGDGMVARLSKHLDLMRSRSPASPPLDRCLNLPLQ